MNEKSSAKKLLRSRHANTTLNSDSDERERSSGVVSSRIVDLIGKNENAQEQVLTTLAAHEGPFADKRTPEAHADDLIVDDIDFNASQNETQVVTETDDDIRRQRHHESREKRRRQHEERCQVSHDVILQVNRDAKRLARRVDDFIGSIHNAARTTHDNPHLLRQLERTRRTCVTFVNALEKQLPGQTSGLFVQEEE